MFRLEGRGWLVLALLALGCLTIAESRRRGPDAYEPKCKEGFPQKQRTVRRCCVERHVEKKCRNLCTTNQHKHVFVGAHLCSFKYQKIIDGCHCGLPPPAPRIAAVISQGISLLQWKHNKLLIVVPVITLMLRLFI